MGYNCCGVLVIVGVVVGCVVGLVVVPNSHSNSKPAAASISPVATAGPTAKSACRGTVCPQILSADAVVPSSSAGSPGTVAVFARGIDNNIWYAMTQASALSAAGPWPTDAAWRNLGGGPFLSQPAAKAWNQLGPSLSVMAVADPDHNVREQYFSAASAQWNASWTDLRGQVSSAVSLCTVNETRVDAWAVENKVVAHNFWDTDVSAFWSPGAATDWQGTTDFGEDVGARPAIACRQNAYIHDLVVYGADKTVRYSTWSGQTSWNPFVSRGGQFQGDPVVLTTSNDRFDFFGVGVDTAMYHFSWTSSAGLGDLESLGGTFQSVASAAVTSSGRIDVVALGANDTLLHRVLQGSAWSPAWEDLGVFANSAPLLLNLSTTPEKVAIFVLGRNGEVNQSTWEVSSDTSWQNLKWSSMGGNMTSAYLGA